jgi:hypothetical protein
MLSNPRSMVRPGSCAPDAVPGQVLLADRSSRPDTPVAHSAGATWMAGTDLWVCGSPMLEVAATPDLTKRGETT